MPIINDANISNTSLISQPILIKKKKKKRSGSRAVGTGHGFFSHTSHMIYAHASHPLDLWRWLCCDP